MSWSVGSGEDKRGGFHEDKPATRFRRYCVSYGVIEHDALILSSRLVAILHRQRFMLR